MNFYPFLFIAFATCSLLLATACSTISEYGYENPFVYNPNEFKRETFTTSPIKTNSITICYNKFGIMPATVSNMAAKECAKNNKSVEFVEKSMLVCPIFTPIGAIFNCCSSSKDISKNSNVLPNSNEIICRGDKL